jgi:ornithine cyclodeaminase
LDTLFIDAESMALLIRRVGLTDCIRKVAQHIHEDFCRWPSFDMAARSAFHSERGVIELMPVADHDHFAMKYVNGHPCNTTAGLPTVMAFGVLADVSTGAPRLVSELTMLTAIRTAAMSALAAQHLARPNSRVMALIGNGAQSEFQALAFRDLVGIRELRIFDTDPKASRKLSRNLANTGLAITVCSSTAEATQGADIVTTLTADKALATILTREMIHPGVHINAVGGDCPGKAELHPDVLKWASVFVEYEPQTRVEGDIQQMPPDFPVTEMWRVFAKQTPGRTSVDQITVFDSVGFALEDFSAMRFIEGVAQRLGIGRQVSLVAHCEDPKDLYGSTTRL